VNEGTDLAKTGTLLYSEAERQWSDAQDWTKNGTNSLTIWFRGLLASVGSFTTGPPIKMTASGADIWGTSDQFHFAYKRLSGNGTITARVVSITNTNASAKAGVMIRESLDPDSKHAMVVIQPTSGVAFQRRADVGIASEQIVNMTSIAAPRWLRLTRSGNTFTAYQSSNGIIWTSIGTVNMPMFADVYVGLCLTSHNINAICTAEFSNLATTSTVTGNWQSQDIGIESNIPEQLYVALQDNANNTAVIKNTDPLATTLITWTEWNIPLTAFAGVNLQAIKKMVIGVGDRADPKAGGSGTLYIDDIWLNRTWLAE
jgi:regulation of enolase protein 1 (concanavalin A-like superfamily)